MSMKPICKDRLSLLHHPEAGPKVLSTVKSVCCSNYPKHHDAVAHSRRNSHEPSRYARYEPQELL